MENVKLPDLSQGVSADRLANGQMLQGKVAEEDVLLVRQDDQFFAVGANCTHYHANLAEGSIVGDEVRCPLHHACFNLRTGMARCAPAFDAIPRWRVERVAETVFVREKLPSLAQYPETGSPKPPHSPSSVVIVGGGAAGLAAADMLRRKGYAGPLAMISADDSAPYDRPNVSKDYIQQPIPDEWMNLRLPDFYKEQGIDLILNSRVSSIDVRRKQLQLLDGKTREYDALLLATGADVIKLAIPGANDSDVFYVRTWSDARALFQKAGSAKRVAVVGASFIGLEVASALRSRGLEVHVVAPEAQPFERTLGAEVGGFFRALHESQGVNFHLGRTVSRRDGTLVTLSDGSEFHADFLVLGVGVRPALALAEAAGLKIDRGVLVNQYLETSVAGIYAAGDIARWPDPHTGQQIRVEHWVVAERQGQIAARNILGHQEPFDFVPFFWTAQFGVTLKYVGHAERWDSIEIQGSLDAHDCAILYKQSGKTLAVATIGRDGQSLESEAALEASLRSSPRAVHD
ncbi:MAG TPA: FAD-dependent oxidoreductase [Methylomirabilota bacterium]|nr:FAD-dependent oxidoreductase [Methylomirabilota bacterium]